MLTGTDTNPLNYLIVLIVFPAESIFFSVHYMVIYYLLQPYNAGTEMKSGMYSIITGLTYLGCYIVAAQKIPIQIFGATVIVFSILYCVVACILVYKFAPKTFRIRT